VIALDSNVLARYFVASADVPTQQQSAAARQLLESGRALFVSKSVLLELEWVLRGYYKSKPKEVLAAMGHLLGMLQVNLEDRVAVELACAALGDGFDFADALHHASARHCTSMATFDDKKFARRATAKGWKPPVKLVAL
jgi:predicted nucleic-acid-binding protein